MKIYQFSDLIIDKNQGINTTTEKVKYTNSGIPVLRAKNILPGYLDLSDLVYVDAEDFNNRSSNYKTHKNEVLYTNIGSQFGNAVLVKDDDNFLITWNILKLIAREEIIKPQYLIYLLNSPNNKNRIKNLNSSSTMPFVSGSVLEKLIFSIHDIPEQQHIVNTNPIYIRVLIFLTIVSLHLQPT